MLSDIIQLVIKCNVSIHLVQKLINQGNIYKNKSVYNSACNHVYLGQQTGIRQWSFGNKDSRLLDQQTPFSHRKNHCRFYNISCKTSMPMSVEQQTLSLTYKIFLLRLATTSQTKIAVVSLTNSSSPLFMRRIPYTFPGCCQRVTLYSNCFTLQACLRTFRIYSRENQMKHFIGECTT